MQKKREWLYTIRSNLRLSTYQAAKKCGISQSFYSGVENGLRTPSVPLAKTIGKTLDFDWQLFYQEEGSALNSLSK